MGRIGLVLAVIVMLLPACATPPITDPVAEMTEANQSPRRHLAAMGLYDDLPDDPDMHNAMHRAIWVPGYATEVRQGAFERLAVRDRENLMRTIRQQLPQMTMWSWLTWLSEEIADRGWTELTPALVSSWARPALSIHDDDDRPEYKALARLHGEDRVIDVVFDLMVQSSHVAEQGLRTRCWNLLHRLGQRERLVELIREATIDERDAMMIDLRAGATDFGLVPYNREEILWLRKLRDPSRADFWSQAASVVATLEPARRAELNVRDLPVLVSASLHAPELLQTGKRELYDQIDQALEGRRRHVAATSQFSRQRLYEHRDKLTWGDLAAMHIALTALQVPQVVSHLFDYAERDRADESTEYGGVIRLDEKGRFEVLEFLPRLRRNDEVFHAPQEMLDAAYTAQFHFHFHVQREHNGDYAGPGFGDHNYADNVRANCLVLTSVGRNVMNVDYYRHDRVVVDLGEIRLP